MVAVAFQAMIDALTCRMCHGNGKLASSTIRMFNGEAHQQRAVSDCPRCDGSGVDPDPKMQDGGA